MPCISVRFVQGYTACIATPPADVKFPTTMASPDGVTITFFISPPATPCSAPSAEMLLVV